MEALESYQLELLEKLKNAEKNYKKSPKERITRKYVETRLETLEKIYSDFNDGHKTIFTQVPKPERTGYYFDNHIQDEFEEIYCIYKTSLKDASEDLPTQLQVQYIAPNEAQPQKLSNQEVRLPIVKIPVFSGKYEEWQTFYDLFSEIIDKNLALAPVQKLQYLKTNLTGEPDRLLRHFTISNTNYEKAWELLVTRYDNKRLHSNTLLKTLFNQRAINTESASSIKQLVDTTTTCLHALENLGVKTETWDLMINYLITTKLDSESIRKWEQQLCLEKVDLPSWSELKQFLEARFRSLEMIETHKPKSVPVPAKPKVFHSNMHQDTSGTEVRKPDIKCAFCKKDEHYIYHCKTFQDLTAKERQDFIQQNKLCFNCMAPSHAVFKCRQPTSCKRCGRRHHTLLHMEKTNEGETASSGIVSQLPKGMPNLLSNDKHIVTNFSNDNVEQSSVLLATAEVSVLSKNGSKFNIRALLDQGSQGSFVTESTVQLLNLTRQSVSGWVSGVGEGQTKIKHMVTLTVKSRHNPNESVEVNAYVLRSLTTLLPTCKLSTPVWVELDGLKLADSNFNTPGRIDILLGAEVYGNIILDGVIKHPNGNLLAQNTILGWVLSGRMSQDAATARRHITSLHIQHKEDDLLKLFWEVEQEPNLIKKKLSKEEEKCEEFYNATTVRDDTGRYVVKLPFKSENPECQNGKSLLIANKRFALLEKRLSKDEKLRNDYSKVIDEYIQLNHMVEVPPSEVNNPKAVYLPHHPVVREDKDTTKLRIVFDASCKGVNNVSLNDDLLVGPKLQQDLRHILMRWRKHKICLTADIIKMYRMIKMASEDTDFQRILWRFSLTKEIKHLKILRLTFGNASAPYLAVKSLQQLAKDEQSKFPVAAAIVLQDFYIDDLLTGCETVSEAVQIYNDMNSLMVLGGFQLQKWSSNNNDVLEYIGENKIAEQDIPLKVNSTMKVLGVNWNRVTDQFEYTVSLPEPQQPVSKRQVLSEVAKLYDPLGWIAPTVVMAKIIIQKLWKSGLEWDDEICGELLTEWSQYRESLRHIKDVSIPRWLHYSPTAKIELHVFSDASQVATSAAVYMRVVEGGRVHVHLISAKTKVAPLSQLSIPRLELCAAALAAKLISETSQVLNIPKENLHAWTDSTIVLAWLKGGASKWTTFVSNRVSEILSILDYEQWSHVTTSTNPADCASRGLLAQDLINNTLWWNGPSWLSKTEIERSTQNEIEDTQEERKVSTLTGLLNTEEEVVWTKFSNLTKMLRVISYCRRWLKYKKNKEECPPYTKFITALEMKETLNKCVKQIQNIHFKEELKQLKSQGQVLKRSSLRSLCPVLDENETLRVSGRIQQSHVQYDTQHPIILPSKSHLTKLIIEDAHLRTLHGGPQLVLNYLRSKYWILRARDLVKGSYRKCVICKRYSKNTSQLMGQLPEVRVKPDRPFRSSGVDFAGPLNIKFSPGRGAKIYKGYICLFVCMSTRAIHIEAVTDLTSKGFIAAFRRFTSRRGHCQDLFSDNGTNFVGADKLLRDMFDRAKSSVPGEIAELLTFERTTWHWIPPHAPNFGGLWESGVRSTKVHLRKVIGETALTYEELSTVLAQVEACLNSRPISVLSDNCVDPLPLTPGHLLIGEPLINLADEDHTISRAHINNLDRWRLTQKMVNDFWNRWYKEYLVNLNQRYKWNKINSEPEIDDVVILREDNIPPSKWILGRIIKKHVGPDNITRVVTVKCKDGIYKRPVTKITVLVNN